MSIKPSRMRREVCQASLDMLTRRSSAWLKEKFDSTYLLSRPPGEKKNRFKERFNH